MPKKIPTAMIALAKELLADGFAYRFICERTGISRQTIAQIARGRRVGAYQPKPKAENVRSKGTPEEFRKIQADAWEALRKAGREKAERILHDAKR